MKLLNLLARLAFVAVAAHAQAQDSVCANIRSPDRIDCLPAKDVPEEKDCVAKKCCWTPSKDNQEVPSCYYPPIYSTYQVSVTRKHDTGYDASSVLTTPSGFKGDAKNVRVTVQYLTKDILRIRVSNYADVLSYLEERKLCLQLAGYTGNHKKALVFKSVISSNLAGLHR